MLVFSFKGKIENIGFWIFLAILLIHITLYILYFKSGINPIKIYISNEMKNNDYEVKNIKNDPLSIYSKKNLKLMIVVLEKLRIIFLLIKTPQKQEGKTIFLLLKVSFQTILLQKKN
jgi:uncharacterized membrane protein YhaH (DUF805 family)